MMAWIAWGTQKVVTYSILGWRPSAILQLVNKSDAGPLNVTYSRRLVDALRSLKTPFRHCVTLLLLVEKF